MDMTLGSYSFENFGMAFEDFDVAIVEFIFSVEFCFQITYVEYENPFDNLY